MLEVETRGFKGPRIYDITGMPLHSDNQSIFKERIHLDKANPNLLHDEITVIDHALTRPWTVDKRYIRNADPLSEWPESICPEYNAWVFTGREVYYLSADGYLMPSKKGPGAARPEIFRSAAAMKASIHSRRRRSGGAGNKRSGTISAVIRCGWRTCTTSKHGTPCRV